MTGEIVAAGLVLGFLTFAAWELRTYQGPGGPWFRTSGWILVAALAGTLIVGGVMLLAQIFKTHSRPSTPAVRLFSFPPTTRPIIPSSYVIMSPVA